MKILAVNYMSGDFALEVVSETPVETAILKHIFEHGEMTRGNGKSRNENGTSVGFYLSARKSPPPKPETE